MGRPDARLAVLLLPLGLAVACIDTAALRGYAPDASSDRPGLDGAAHDAAGTGGAKDGGARDGAAGAGGTFAVDGHVDGLPGVGGGPDAGRPPPDALTATDAGDAGPLLDPPRLIAPLSTSTVTSSRPTLKWQLTGDTDGVHVELCRERPCSSIVVSFDVTGTSGAPDVALDPGVWFWRAYPARQGVADLRSVSPTWQFKLGPGNTALVDSSWGTYPDLDGDGRADPIVGHSTPSGDSGTVTLYLGSAGGLPFQWMTLGDLGVGGAHFGSAVASAGDVDGDGFPDIIVGAPGSGTAYLYLGGIGIEKSPAYTLVGSAGHFGAAIASAGDVDGDGYADVVVGDTDGAHVFFGGPAGLRSITALVLPTSVGDVVAVAGAGDMNGDGLGDIVVAGPGGAAVYFGPPTTVPTLSFGLNDGAACAHTSVASAGDLDGDGYADVVLGAVCNAATRAVVLFGGPGSTLPATNQGSPFVVPGGSGGITVAGAGDVNDDGFADLLIGTSDASGATTGKTYLTLGAASRTIADPVEVDLHDAGTSIAAAGDVDADGRADVLSSHGGVVSLWYGAQTGLATASGTLLDVASSDSFAASVTNAGDVNGDGYGDVIVSAPGNQALYVYLGSPTGLSPAPAEVLTPFVASEFTSVVASAGDVNHDGYGDVIVSAPNEPGVYLFLGGPTGLASSPAITLDPPDGSGSFGSAIAGVGDVNHDGYADVVIGQPMAASSSGLAYLYLGGATGLPPSPSVTLSNPAGQAATQFGEVVAAAGDVNGDGHADVAVATEGVVYVFSGTATGLARAPLATLAGPPAVSAFFGTPSPVIAADVNGDGYSDIVIGSLAPSVYLGGPSGLAGAAAVALINAQGQAFAEVPMLVNAGDVNGDGYADVVVDDGSVSLFLGSASGLPSTPSLTIAPPDGGVSFGPALAGGMDIDGDGHTDLIASGSGLAYVFAGSPSGFAVTPSLTLVDPTSFSISLARLEPRRTWRKRGRGT